MVLGKKYDPMSDSNFKHLVTAENKAVAAEKKLMDLEVEIEDISNGHLDKNLQPEAFKSLLKRLNCVNEELARLLESLDGVQLSEDQLGKVAE